MRLITQLSSRRRETDRSSQARLFSTETVVVVVAGGGGGGGGRIRSSRIENVSITNVERACGSSRKDAILSIYNYTLIKKLRIYSYPLMRKINFQRRNLSR